MSEKRDFKGISRREFLKLSALGLASIASLAIKLGIFDRSFLKKVFESISQGKVREDISERLDRFVDHQKIEIGEKIAYQEPWINDTFQSADIFKIDYEKYFGLGFFEVTSSCQVLEYSKNMKEGCFQHYKTLQQIVDKGFNAPAILPRTQFDEDENGDVRIKNYLMYAAFKDDHGKWDESFCKTPNSVHRGGIVVTEQSTFVADPAEFNMLYRNRDNLPKLRALIESAMQIDSQTWEDDFKDISNIQHNEPDFWDKDLVKAKENTSWYVTLYFKDGSFKTFVVSAILNSFYDEAAGKYDFKRMVDSDDEVFRNSYSRGFDLRHVLELTDQYAKLQENVARFVIAPMDPGSASNMYTPISITRQHFQEYGSQDRVKGFERIDELEGKGVTRSQMIFGNKVHSTPVITNSPRYVLVSLLDDLF